MYVMEDWRLGWRVCLSYSNSHRTHPHIRPANHGKVSNLGVGTSPFAMATREKPKVILDSKYRQIWRGGVGVRGVGVRV